MLLREKIDVKEATTLLRHSRGKRDQVNGLVFHRTQMPTKKSDNGWKCIVRSPTSGKEISKHRIKTDDGLILVEYLQVDLDLPVKDAVDYFLSNHNETRNIDGENGIMTMAGHRIDLPLSSKLDYAPSSGDNRNHSKYYLDNGAASFHDLLLGTICAESLRNEIQQLSSNGKFVLFVIV